MTLRIQGFRADNRDMRPSWTSRASGLGSDERGQGVVEFALILPVFVLLITGIIQFGIALNYWLDMQRIANQGARWAAVNNWPPDCPEGTSNSSNGGNGCTQTPACNARPSQPTYATLQNVLSCQLLTNGEQNTTIQVCYPSGTSNVGDPVRVRLSRPFNVIGIPFLGGGLGSITIRGSATMRLEQSQSAADNGLLTGVTSC